MSRSLTAAARRRYAPRTLCVLWAHVVAPTRAERFVEDVAGRWERSALDLEEQLHARAPELSWSGRAPASEHDASSPEGGPSGPAPPRASSDAVEPAASDEAEATPPASSPRPGTRRSAAVSPRRSLPEPSAASSSSPRAPRPASPVGRRSTDGGIGEGVPSTHLPEADSTSDADAPPGRATPEPSQAVVDSSRESSPGSRDVGAPPSRHTESVAEPGSLDRAIDPSVGENSTAPEESRGPGDARQAPIRPGRRDEHPGPPVGAKAGPAERTVVSSSATPEAEPGTREAKGASTGLEQRSERPAPPAGAKSGRPDPRGVAASVGTPLGGDSAMDSFGPAPMFGPRELSPSVGGAPRLRAATGPVHFADRSDSIQTRSWMAPALAAGSWSSDDDLDADESQRRCFEDWARERRWRQAAQEEWRRLEF